MITAGAEKPLAKRRGAVSTFENQLIDQQVGKGMQQHKPRHQVWILQALMGSSALRMLTKQRRPFEHIWPAFPRLDGRLIELKEDPFPIYIGRKPRFAELRLGLPEQGLQVLEPATVVRFNLEKPY